MKLVKDPKFYKTLFLIALPAAFQSLISLGVNMLDNVMVGSLGDVPLAAVSLCNQVTTLLAFFIKGISGGSAVLISQYWGKKDLERIKLVFAVVFRFGLLCTCLVTALIFFFPGAAIRIFTNEENLIQAGIPYIKILCFSYILYVISDVVIAMLRWVEVVKIGLVVSSVSLLTNMIFNYILIFGKLGAPALGIRGAAVATLLSRAVELTIVLVYVFCFDRRLQLKLRDLWVRDRQILRDFFRYGIPIVVGDMQWGLVGLAKAMLIGRLGVIMVAANSIADVILSLALIFTNGLASGACVLVGKSVGEGDYQKTRSYSTTIQFLFTVIGLAVCALVFFTRQIPPQFYNVSEETKVLASQFLAIGAFTHLGTCYHMACFTGINRGAGDGKFVMKVDMICGWFIVIPLTFLAGFVFHLPLPAVYLCTRIDQTFKWVIAMIRLKGDKWIHNVTQAA